MLLCVFTENYFTMVRTPPRICCNPISKALRGWGSPDTLWSLVGSGSKACRNWDLIRYPTTYTMLGVYISNKKYRGFRPTILLLSLYFLATFITSLTIKKISNSQWIKNTIGFKLQNIAKIRWLSSSNMGIEPSTIVHVCTENHQPRCGLKQQDMWI